MDLHSILARPMQIVKEVLDLEPDLESPSLASQFVAIKHQLAEVQARLNESHRISREKDVVIAKLQKAMATRSQPPTVVEPARPAKVKPRKPIAQGSSARERVQVSQTEAVEEVKLPAVASYEEATQRAKSARPRAGAKTTSRRVRTTAKAKPSARAAAPATVEKAKSTRTRAAAKKTGTAASASKAKKTTRAGKPAASEKAKSTRTRTAAKKPAAKTKAKATAKPKRAPRARKS